MYRIYDWTATPIRNLKGIILEFNSFEDAELFIDGNEDLYDAWTEGDIEILSDKSFSKFIQPDKPFI